MLSFYRILLTFFNIIFFFIGISFILTSKDMQGDSQAIHEKPCTHENANSYLVMGITILIITIIGILISCCNSRLLEFTYKWILTVLAIVVVISFTFITSLMPSKEADLIFAGGSGGYWMQQFNPILPKVMTNDRDWFVIKQCYIDNNICGLMLDQSNDQKDYFVDLGCCIPPNRCNMKQANLTTWVQAPGPFSDDPECRTWKMKAGPCFDCETCKAGYLTSFKRYWEQNYGTLVTRLSAIVFMAALAWVAFREVPDDDERGPNKSRLAKSYLNP